MREDRKNVYPLRLTLRQGVRSLEKGGLTGETHN